VTIQYLFPCSCGRKTPVESRQAGEATRCDCGATLEIPRLLELKKLERVAFEARETENIPNWGIGHSLIVSAVVVLAGVLLLWMGISYFMPGNPYDRMTPEQTRAQSAKMTPVETWETWQYFQQVGLNPPKERIDRYIEGQYAKRQMLLTYLGIAAAGGVALLVAGIFLAGKRPRRPS
jgi:hypothetical protein